MTKTLLWRLAVVGMVVGLSACASNYEVKTQAPINPMVGCSQFTLAPVEYVNLTVDGKPEAEYVQSKKDDKGKAEWAKDKQDILELIQKNLTDTLQKNGVQLAAGSKFVIRPTVSTIETGYYRIPAWNAVTRIFLKLVIADASSSSVVDEIVVKDEIPFDLIGAPTTGGRMRSVATNLGTLTAKYVLKRSRE